MKRKLPYGYTLSNGQISVDKTEAQVVQQIFQWYLGGLSCQQISDRLAGSGIPYVSDQPKWNKCAVARILKSPDYNEESRFPPLISESTSKRAGELIRVKSTVRKKPEEIKLLESLAVCGKCGGRLAQSMAAGQERWHCRGTGCGRYPITAEDILRRTQRIVSRLAANPALVRWEKKNLDELATPEIREMERQLDRELEKEDFDAALITRLTYGLASERYRLCGDQCQQTARIQEYLTFQAFHDNPTLKDIREIAKHMIIHPDGAVSLRLHNQQEVGEF